MDAQSVHNCCVFCVNNSILSNYMFRCGLNNDLSTKTLLALQQGGAFFPTSALSGQGAGEIYLLRGVGS